jgi:hypothetical protein
MDSLAGGGGLLKIPVSIKPLAPMLFDGALQAQARDDAFRCSESLAAASRAGAHRYSCRVYLHINLHYAS